VSLSYDIDEKKKVVDVIVKEKNNSYWMGQVLFFNPLSFFIWGYSGLLLLVAGAFRQWVRPIPFTNVKYLHIDNPNPAYDVVTINRPRWSFTWSWFF
jgi:hypothetical protein